MPLCFDYASCVGKIIMLFRFPQRKGLEHLVFNNDLLFGDAFLLWVQRLMKYLPCCYFLILTILNSPLYKKSPLPYILYFYASSLNTTHKPNLYVLQTFCTTASYIFSFASHISAIQPTESMWISDQSQSSIYFL